jgi:type III pantothenate kinase
MESLQAETIGDASRLVVVIGNTTTTIALFQDGPEPMIENLPSAVFDDAAVMAERLEGVVGKFTPAVTGAAICSVVPGIAARCAGMLEGMLSIPVLLIGSTLRLPFSLHYENSQAFGADRIALCAWSRKLFPQQAHIAVDIGTAITFDVLDSKGSYVGGLIMPGLDMMSGALHSRTAQLPLVSIEKSTNLLGRSTGECIRSGIFWGAVKQIDGLIEEITRYLREQYGEDSVGVIATGGNSRLIAGEIKSIDVVDELAVVRGSRLLFDLNIPGLKTS